MGITKGGIRLLARTVIEKQKHSGFVFTLGKHGVEADYDELVLLLN